jgi:hypothetical protein
MGALMKQTSTKASAAVGHGMSKLRHSSPRHPGSPSFAEALSEQHVSLHPVASSTLPDFPEASMDESESEEMSDVAPVDSAGLDSIGGTSVDGHLEPNSPPRSMSTIAEGVAIEDAGIDSPVPVDATNETVADEGPLPAATVSGAFAMEPPKELRAIYLRLQASDVKVVGEKGTKIPNFTVKELALLLECRMEAAFEWTEIDGWRATHKLKLQIDSFSGTTIPVPKTLLKYLLNMLLPAIIEARLLAVLPAEMGQYFIEKATPGVQTGGKLNVFGPSLRTLNADLALDPSIPPTLTGECPTSQTHQLSSAAMLLRWRVHIFVCRRS